MQIARVVVHSHAIQVDIDLSRCKSAIDYSENPLFACSFTNQFHWEH